MANIKLTNSVKVVSDSLAVCINPSNRLISVQPPMNQEWSWTATADCWFSVHLNTHGNAYCSINNVWTQHGSTYGGQVHVCGVMRKGDVMRCKQDAGDGANSITIFGLK